MSGVVNARRRGVYASARAKIVDAVTRYLCSSQKPGVAVSVSAMG